MTVTTPKYNPQVKKRDWAPVKAAFVEGYERDGVRLAEPQLGDVATKFGIPLSTVKKRAMVEKWTAERQIFQKRLEGAKRERTTEVLVSKGAEFDNLNLSAAEVLVKALLKRLLQKADELTPNQLAAMAQALKGGQFVGRLVMGDSTDNARLYAELLQKPDLSALSPAELEQLEALLGKARPV